MDDKSVDGRGWRTARNCEGGACVEVGAIGDAVFVRRTTEPDGICVSLSRDEWQVFVAGVKDGDFDGL